MYRALSCLQDEWDIKEDFAKGKKLPSSQVSNGDTAQGFLQCCIQIPADDVTMSQLSCKKRTWSGANVRMNALYIRGVCLKWDAEMENTLYSWRQKWCNRDWQSKIVEFFWDKIQKFIIQKRPGWVDLQSKLHRISGKEWEWNKDKHQPSTTKNPDIFSLEVEVVKT